MSMFVYKGEGGQKYPDFCLRGFYTVPISMFRITHMVLFALTDFYYAKVTFLFSSPPKSQMKLGMRIIWYSRKALLDLFFPEKVQEPLRLSFFLRF